jgi:predicted ATPase
VFAGHFTLPSARHVAAHTDLDDRDVLDALNGLVSKNLLSVAALGDVPGFRLLDTTRTYAATKLAESGEGEALRRRQATYYCDVLRDAEGDLRRTGDAADIDNIRAALRWAFGKNGDASLGADLAAYSAPVWLSKALLSECHAWMSRAAVVHADNRQASHQLLLILIAQGVAEFQMGGLSKESTANWSKTLELTEALQDTPRQLFAHVILWTRAIRESWYADALAAAERFSGASAKRKDSAFRATSEWVLGHTMHHLGRHKEAKMHFDACLDSDTEEARLSFVRASGIDRRSDLSAIMANTLWLTGLPDQAARWGERAIAEARALKLEMSVGAAMIWAGLNKYLSETDAGDVERDMVELLEHARSFPADSEAGFALSILGLCQARRGEFDAGRQTLREGLRHLADAHVESFSPLVLGHFCEVALVAKRLGDAVDLMSELKARDRNAEHFCMPEILRVRARLALSQGAEEMGESLFHDAIAMARGQGALSWELRAATSLAKYLISKKRHDEARAVLAPTYERFSEGFGTADLRAAHDTLSELKKIR